MATSPLPRSIFSGLAGFCALTVLAVQPLAAQDGWTPLAADLAFLSALEKSEVQYFIDQPAPPNYLMPVTWSVARGPDRRASCDGTGLELAALCIADSHGWLPRATAVARATAILSLAARLQIQHPETKGLLYHYLNPDGSRYRGDSSSRGSNVGTDDGSKFILGALTARQYFSDPTITRLANQIYRFVDWQAWVDPKNHQAYEAWAPESGFSRSRWGRYSEGPVQLYLLGLGAPSHAFTAANWNSWTRGPVNTYGKHPAYRWIGASPALFVHQYPQAFYYLHGAKDDSAAGRGMNYWDNSVQATLAQWQWSQDLGRGSVNGVGPFPHWGQDLWGLTATVSPSRSFNTWGGPMPSEPPPDGTLTPAAAGGSIPFTPAQSLRTLEYIRAHYAAAWTQYGFVEAFNPETGWSARQLSTNHTGQTLLMAENYVTGLVWRAFMSSPEIGRAMKLAQFSGQIAAPPPETPAGESRPIQTKSL